MSRHVSEVWLLARHARKFRGMRINHVSQDLGEWIGASLAYLSPERDCKGIVGNL